jgi:hypothetical protein
VKLPWVAGWLLKACTTFGMDFSRDSHNCSKRSSVGRKWLPKIMDSYPYPTQYGDDVEGGKLDWGLFSALPLFFLSLVSFCPPLLPLHPTLKFLWAIPHSKLVSLSLSLCIP